MRRREFISVIAGATAWSLGARAQQPAMPVVGTVGPAPWEAANSHLLAAFRRGLAEAGYVEGQNLAIEPRVTKYRPELREVLRRPRPQRAAICGDGDGGSGVDDPI